MVFGQELRLKCFLKSELKAKISDMGSVLGGVVI